MVLMGPTGAGKSAHALAIAVQRPTVIINADAMQMVDSLRVLTARPTVAEEAAAEHALYGVLKPHEPTSVAVWLALVQPVIRRAWEEGKLPLAKKVNSWTNMWRVDDPIGQDVELVTSPMHIENKGMDRGGHTMYWKENRVCEKIVGLIHQPGTCAAKPEFAAGPSLKVESLLA